MQELKIERILEKTEEGDSSAMMVRLEAGGLGILSRFGGVPKVCFVLNLETAIAIYVRCAIEVHGGYGYLWCN